MWLAIGYCVFAALVLACFEFYVQYKDIRGKLRDAEKDAKHWKKIANLYEKCGEDLSLNLRKILDTYTVETSLLKRKLKEQAENFERERALAQATKSASRNEQKASEYRYPTLASKVKSEQRPVPIHYVGSDTAQSRAEKKAVACWWTVDPEDIN